jgi:hypothetical protein
VTCCVGFIVFLYNLVEPLVELAIIICHVHLHVKMLMLLHILYHTYIAVLLDSLTYRIVYGGCFIIDPRLQLGTCNIYQFTNYRTE